MVWPPIPPSLLIKLTVSGSSTINTGWAPLRLLAIYNPGGPEKDLETLPDFTHYEPGTGPDWKLG